MMFASSRPTLRLLKAAVSAAVGCVGAGTRILPLRVSALPPLLGVGLTLPALRLPLSAGGDGIIRTAAAGGEQGGGDESGQIEGGFVHGVTPVLFGIDVQFIVFCQSTG